MKKNIRVFRKLIMFLALFLGVFGIILMIFVRTNDLFGCLSLIIIGGAMISFGYALKLKYREDLISLDKNFSIMLKDVALLGEKSEYYGVIDEEKKWKVLKKFMKKNKNNCLIFYIFGGMLIFCGLIALI